MSYPLEHQLLPRGAKANWYLNAGLGWPSEPSENPWRSSAYIVEPPRQFPRPAWDHAAPLSEIPGRDLEEMADWFDRGDMPELAADVQHLLDRLLPEPAWDDDAWAFLQECHVALDSESPQYVNQAVGIGHRFDTYL